MSKSFTRILFTIGLIALVGSLLAKPKSENEIEYMIKIFLDGIQKAFGKLNQAQVESITQIVWSFQIHGDRDLRKLTYILATAWHESKFLLVKEKEERQVLTYTLDKKLIGHPVILDEVLCN